MAEDLKIRLYDAIRELLEVKTLRKITIRELSNKVGINRQTFYYHFQDIYDLTLHMFNREITEVLSSFDPTQDFALTVQKLIDYAFNNKQVFLNTISNLDAYTVQLHLHREISSVIGFAVQLREKALNIQLEKEDEKEITDFYTYYISGELLHWFQTGLKELDVAKSQKIGFLITNNFDKNIKDLYALSKSSLKRNDK